LWLPVEVELVLERMVRIGGGMTDADGGLHWARSDQRRPVGLLWLERCVLGGGLTARCWMAAGCW
jgi:hypothetical protein